MGYFRYFGCLVLLPLCACLSLVAMSNDTVAKVTDGGRQTFIDWIGDRHPWSPDAFRWLAESAWDEEQNARNGIKPGQGQDTFRTAGSVDIRKRLNMVGVMSDCRFEEYVDSEIGFGRVFERRSSVEILNKLATGENKDEYTDYALLWMVRACGIPFSGKSKDLNTIKTLINDFDGRLWAPGSNGGLVFGDIRHQAAGNRKTRKTWYKLAQVNTVQNQLQQAHIRYKDVLTVIQGFLPPEDIYYLTGPEQVEKVLSKNKANNSSCLVM